MTLRSRYLSLFPTSGYYRTSNMKVLSSSSLRCIASLTSFMAGFMPPPAIYKTLPIKWQAFPFSVDNEAQVLSVKPEVCAKYLQEYVYYDKAIYNTTNAWQSYKQDKATIDKVATLMGAPLTNPSDVAMAAETIRSNQYLDPSTPGWAVNAMEGPLLKYFLMYMDTFHATDYMVKVRGGPMLTQIVDNLVAMRDKNSTAKNLMVYSAHDYNLLSLALMLNVESQVPENSFYSDTMSIELHQTGVNEPKVQVWYFSHAAKKPFKKELSIASCGTPCKLSKFLEVTNNYMVRDFDALCQL